MLGVDGRPGCCHIHEQSSWQDIRRLLAAHAERGTGPSYASGEKLIKMATGQAKTPSDVRRRFLHGQFVLLRAGLSGGPSRCCQKWRTRALSGDQTFAAWEMPMGRSIGLAGVVALTAADRCSGTFGARGDRCFIQPGAAGWG